MRRTTAVRPAKYKSEAGCSPGPDAPTSSFSASAKAPNQPPSWNPCWYGHHAAPWRPPWQPYRSFPFPLLCLSPPSVSEATWSLTKRARQHRNITPDNRSRLRQRPWRRFGMRRLGDAIHAEERRTNPPRQGCPSSRCQARPLQEVLGSGGWSRSPEHRGVLVPLANARIFRAEPAYGLSLGFHRVFRPIATFLLPACGGSPGPRRHHRQHQSRTQWRVQASMSPVTRRDDWQA